jgi:RND family efflux transporter MFP subunit
MLLHFATCLQRVEIIFANKKQQYSMKNYILTGTLCMFLLGGCGEHAHDHEHEGHDHEAEIHAEEKTAHSDEIVLTPEKAKAAGVEAEVIHPGAFREVIQAGGQILSAQGQEATVVAASSGVVSFSRKIAEGIEVGQGSELLSVSAEHIQEGDPVRKAKVAYEKAKEEYERAEKLVGSQIVSQKEFAALREAYQNARLTYEALLPSKSGKGVAVKAPIGGFVKNCLVKEGDYVTVGQPLMTVTQMRRLVLKADVSERYYAQLPRIVSANFKTPYNNKVYCLENLGGKVLSFGKSSGDMSYYVPVTFEFDNRGDMVPGAFVEVFLLSGERQGVISLPESALTEEQGLYFVYLKLDDECYKKQEVQLGTSNGERVEILSGLKDGDTVVTRGAIHVKLAAASNAIPAHSHNH